MELPIIGLSRFLENNGNCCKEECEQLAESLRTYGAVAVRDPRVQESDSLQFLDMMERYFEQSTQVKLKDARPELYYQVGVTPEYTEQPRDNSAYAGRFSKENQPTSFEGKDCKWRFQWRMGCREETSKYPELVADPVIPECFPEWSQVMNSWGEKLIAAGYTIAEMLAIGLNLSPDAFTNLLRNGSHLLAPTGVDLSIYGHRVGHVIAGFHYDLNFLTLHGKARYPGLFLWTRTGKRIPCRIPFGCLLVQVGSQLEYLTAGYLERGFHEVVVTQDMKDLIEERKKENASLWRVSSTLFIHVAPDALLEPLEHFQASHRAKNYPTKPAGQQVAEELEAIKLSTKKQ
eukprot:jgi/Galph1/5058/GphlegSOOS_G3696.1